MMGDTFAIPVTYTLPQPPSTNELYSGGRYKTARYKAWRKHAGQELMLIQRAKPVRYPVEVEIALPGRCDLDNLKAAIDIFVSMGVLPDDSRKWVRKITIEPANGDDVVVTLRPALVQIPHEGIVA